MYRFISADLHLHSVLSPCASREMLPGPVLERAEELGLQMIAITDHNTAGNVAAFQEAAEGTGITVLPGMEVQTREEVHLLCLFDTLEQAEMWQEEVYAHLPDLKNDERFFGEQWLVDAKNQILRHEDRLLLVSADLSVSDAAARIKALGGLCIPSHVDRPAYSIISQLGFIPPDLEVIAVEISHRATPAQMRSRFPQLQRLGMVANSDAHYLHDMQKRNTFKIKEPTVAEVALALAGGEGREMWIDGLQP